MTLLTKKNVMVVLSSGILPISFTPKILEPIDPFLPHSAMRGKDIAVHCHLDKGTALDGVCLASRPNKRKSGKSLAGGSRSTGSLETWDSVKYLTGQAVKL